MIMSSSLLWIVFSLMCCLKTVTGADHSANIISPPQSVNATLNGVVKLNCTYVGENVRWEANGQKIFDGQNGFEITDVPVTSISAMTTLTVVISLEKNNTNITCVVVTTESGLSTAESDPALLLVQGLLESVSNLTVTLINSTTVLISWIPPFTLEGVPILGYNVTITNTTSGENETMLVEDTTTLLYSIDHPDPENNFTVTVIPINEVGAGQLATLDSFNFETITTYSSTLPQPIFSLMVITNIMTTQSFTIVPMSNIVTVTSTGTVAATDASGSLIGIVVGVVSGGLIFVIFVILIVIVAICRRRKYRGLSSQQQYYRLSSESDFEERDPSSRLASTDYADFDKFTFSQSIGSTADSEKTFLQSTTVFPSSQPVEQSPQSVMTVTLHHNTKMRRLEPNSNQLLPAATVKAVPVSGDQSNEFSAYVLPDSNSKVVMRNPQKIGKKQVSFLLIPKDYQTQVYLLPDEDDPLSYSSISQDNTDKMDDAVMVTSLRRTCSSSEINLVPGGVEASSTHLEYISHPLGSDDARVRYKRLKQIKRVKFLSDRIEEEEDLPPNNPLLDLSENESTFSRSDETYHVLSSKPKQTQYADVVFSKQRSKALPSMTNPVVYATISGVSREPMYGNIGKHKRQAAAKIDGVPTEEQRNFIAHQVRHKWLLIGLHLGVDQAELEQITHECSGDNSLCCSELFRKWATQEVSTSSPFTWKAVIEALDNDVVRESSLARQLT